MILRRLGNKSKLADKIISYFPKDITCFIDLFFGTGSITWRMLDLFPNINYIGNDIDENIHNLWLVLIDEDKKIKLHDLIYYFPYTTSSYKFVLKEFKPLTDIEKVFKFLILSNFSLYGKSSSLRIVAYQNNSKFFFLDSIIKIRLDKLKFVQFNNLNFKDFVLPVSCPENRPNCINGQFVYADPPYIGTKGNYDIFTENDSNDLFEKLCNSDLRFAYSEFDNPFILEQAKQRNLNVIILGERRNLGNRRTEILVTNYETERSLFD